LLLKYISDVVMFQALSTSTGTNLTLQLLPSAAKLLASTDLVTKKLASWYVARHSSAYSDISVLAVNTLVTDTHDPNPVVRSLAIRTLARIQLPELAEHSINAVNSGLKDSDAVVRRAAVLAGIQIFKMAPSAILDGGLVDSLYTLIRDPDPIVVVNCLDTLQCRKYLLMREVLLSIETWLCICCSGWSHFLSHSVLLC